MNGHNGPSGNYPDADGLAGANRDYDRGRGGPTSRRRSAATGTPHSVTPLRPTKAPLFALDAASILRPASRRWYWLVLGVAAGIVGGWMLGKKLWSATYSASAQLVRYEAQVTGDAYRPQLIRGETLLGVSKSPEVLRKAVENSKMPEHLLGGVNAAFERQSDIVNVHAVAKTPEAAIALANGYTEAFIGWTQENQRQEATVADKNNRQYLADNEADLAAARKLLPSGVQASSLVTTTTTAPSADGASAPVTLSARRLEQIQKAEEELAEALVQYTENHPDVKTKRMRVAQLRAGLPEDWSYEGALAAARARAGASGGDASSSDPAVALAPTGPSREEAEIALVNVRTFELLKNQLIARQRTIEIFKNNPPGNFRVIQPASSSTVGRQSPTMKIGVLSAFFGMVGLFLAIAAALGRELLDSRLKTEDDVARVTRLPIIATLGDVKKMSQEERDDWAFRTWISLQNRLAYSPNHGLICGFTSSNEGEGRSTWIGLLAGAARKYGFRVLTIATRSAEGVASAEELEKQVAQEAELAGAARTSEARVGAVNGHKHEGGVTAVAEPGTGRTSTMLTHPDEFGAASRSFGTNSDFTALTASALFTPAVVTEKLTGPESDPLVHIPLPGWTWNLERRKQWQGALNVWRKIDNVVILVELPPASMPESVLLASNLPNLVWVAESGKSEAATTRAQLETLRNARCNIVGAVINRALKPVAEGKFSRWVATFATLAALHLAGGLESTAFAQAAAPAPAASPEASGPAAFSVSSPAQRAKWQQKLTLGPGDVLSFNLFGNPEALRQDVRIGPDGRVSYLEAQGVRAAGLTVDEFREEMNKELSKYRRAPQVFVVPVSYNSKKYFVLGRVAQRGAFPLDRPLTLVEAVARAGGLETGMAADRSLVELADLSRSFIARDNKRLPVNFEKLFLEGDLSQNIPLEPNDYIYFPGGSEKEVFVLGAVRLPGAHTYHTSIGVIGAIAGRGGFNERAWQSKLLVIRGGLGRPETIEIDAFDVLSGKKPDIQLKPRDIVYVADRPWIYAEQLLDAAADAFVTAAVVTWTGEKVTRE